ncbi:MAG: hypothetical protein IJV22_05760 [Bacteroidales bacterium]|nr:hypothetical protein [Bacteroidales bacterium]
MNIKKIVAVGLFAAASITGLNGAQAQEQVAPISTLRLEMRADAQADFLHNAEAERQEYRFRGKYFNLHMGGSLNGGFSYYFRQRIIANPGSSTLFDNTDFLWLNYAANERWNFRVGKDALAVGGFEYDAPPIDVYVPAVYWNQFYCFQLGASAAYTFGGGNHSLRLQLANSPAMHYGAPFDEGIFALNLLWSGSMGHFKTLYSAGVLNLYKDNSPEFLYVALGNKWDGDVWKAYVDLMMHSMQFDQVDYLGLVGRVDYALSQRTTLFAKAGLELADKNEMVAYARYAGATAYDYLSVFDASVLGKTYGSLNENFVALGAEFRPAKCPAVRFHGFVAKHFKSETSKASSSTDNPLHTWTFNVGATWNVDVKGLLSK